MVHSGQFTFPLCLKSYLVFTYGLSAEPLGVLTFFSLSPPTLPQRPSHTCRHLCFCPASCLPPTPLTHTWFGRSRHPCLWLCQSTPLFHLTIQLAPDNSRKRRFISILFSTPSCVVLFLNSWNPSLSKLSDSLV